MVTACRSLASLALAVHALLLLLLLLLLSSHYKPSRSLFPAPPSVSTSPYYSNT